MNFKKLKLKLKIKTTTGRKVKVISIANNFKGIKKMKNVAAKMKLRRSFKKSVKNNNAKVDTDAGISIPMGTAKGIGTATATAAANASEAGVVKGSNRNKWIKKILRPRFPRPRIIQSGNNNSNSNAKNIIIIHNNTSISSNDDFNKSSCVDVTKDAIDESVKPNSDEDEDDEEKEMEATICAEVSLPKEVDIVDLTSVGSASPPPPDQASKDEEEEEEDEEEEIAEIVEVEDESKRQIDNVMIKVDMEDIRRFTKDEAIVVIQSAFRAHLARRAYRALKSLVKLQAVVRGVCVRRQARIALHCMNTLARLQLRVRDRQLLIA